MRKQFNFYNLLLIILLFNQDAISQRWVEMMQDPTVDFYTVQRTFNQEWGNRPYERGKGWKQYKRWEYFMEDRVFPHGKRPRTSVAWEEYEKFKAVYEKESASTKRNANWTPLGPVTWTNTTGYNPGNGRINCVAVDPVNTNIIYVGAPSGGLWKSTNGGNNWVCLTDDLPVLGVSAILIDPNNTNNIYIGTGDADGSDTYSIGVLKSTDGGQSWNNTALNWTIGNSRLIRRMIMHPNNNQIIFAATNDGVYKTTNGGVSWAQTQTGNMRDIEFKPGDPTIVYACSDQFYKSTNSGNSFTLVNTGLPASTLVNRASIAVTPANPNYVYILYGDETDSGFFGLYRSANSGSSFTLRSNSPNIFSYPEDGSEAGGQSWYDMALAVSNTNPEEIFSGGINVWKSNDGGTNWINLTHWVYPATVGYVHADIHTLDMLGNTLFCGSDGGIFKSTNNGTSWTDLSNGLEIMQFYRFGVSAQNGYKMIGGAQDNGTNYLNAGIWSHVLGADGMEAAIDYSNALVMYGEYQNGGLNRTLDGGQNWDYIAPTNGGDASWVTPFVIDPNVPTTIYAGYEEVWKSTDRGDNWTAISNFANSTTLNYIAVAKTNSNYIYTGRGAALYKTINGGTSWTNITPAGISSAIKYIVIDPLNEQRIWISLSGYNAGEKVFYSSNAGSSWQNISYNLPNLPVNCIEYQAGTNDGLYVGTDVGIFYKDNNLANWQSYMTGLPNVIVNELEIHYGVGKIRAATYGRGVWESDLYSPSPFPPDAAFTYGQAVLCSGDSIGFSDQSINAAPGWQWYFPGGSPSTSTSQNPRVLYAAEGSYQASLIVSNANGTDTITQNVNVDFADNQIRVNIIFDSYPTETSWQITDSTGTIMASGGPYSQGNTSIDQLVCLPDGCYEFTVFDSYSDGLCCGYGNGSYSLIDTGNIVIGTGGQFSSQESVNFCFNATAPVNIDQVNSVISGCGLDNGTLTVLASGGNGTYQYSIDGINYQTNNVFNQLAPGTYLVFTSDNSGSIDSSFATVFEIPGPTAVASSSNPNVYLSSGANVNFSGILSNNVSAYFWDFGDGSTSTSMTTSHAFTAVGTYTVVLTVSKDSCFSSDTVIVNVSTASSTELSSKDVFGLELRPNPILEQFEILIELPEASNDVEIYIHNALGQLIYWEKVDSYSTTIKRQLNFSNESNGFYFLSVQSKKQRQFLKFAKGS